MALDKQGKARLARKVVSIGGARDDNGFALPLAINYFASKYCVLTSDDILGFTLPGYNMVDSGFGSNPSFSIYSDAVIFNSLYVASTSTSTYTWDGTTGVGAWTDKSTSLTASVNHPMAVFGVLLAIGNGNTVKLFDTSYVASSAVLTLPTSQRVVTMRAVGDYLYVGTKNLNGGNAKIYVWDGDSNAFNYEVEVGASWVYALTPYRSSVAAITSEGQLGWGNGTNFEELGALPVYYEPHARWQDSTGLLTNGKVFNRGIATVGDCIYLNIEGEIDQGFVPGMKSGLWVYDPSVGLYHRAGASLDKVRADSSLTRSGDTLTTSSAHGLKTGDAVSFDSVSGLTGVSAEVSYYVTVISSTQIKLSQTRKGVANEQYVTLGGTPGGSDILAYAPNTDYYAASATSGAILPATYLETPHPNFATEVYWASRFELQDGTTEYGVFSFSDQWNVGSLTTQRVYSDNVDDSWQQLYNYLDGVVVDTEQIVVKAQTRYEEPTKKLDGVWLSSTVLNSKNASDFTAWSDVEEGDEVVIIDGAGRGYSAHVSERNASSSTMSLTLDEAVGTANSECTVYFTTFKKIGTYTKDNKDKEKIKTSLEGLASPWIAIKLEMRGFQPSLNTMELSHLIHKK